MNKDTGNAETDGNGENAYRNEVLDRISRMAGALDILEFIVRDSSEELSEKDFEAISEVIPVISDIFVPMAVDIMNWHLRSRKARSDREKAAEDAEADDGWRIDRYA